MIFFLLITWLVRRVRRLRREALVEQGNGTATLLPTCPICEKANRGEWFRMPRLAERQRELIVGPYRLLWAREIHEADVQACAGCAEEAWAAARLKLQGLVVARARETERELEELVRWQREVMTPRRQRGAA
jgi:hypothetical protein